MKDLKAIENRIHELAEKANLLLKMPQHDPIAVGTEYETWFSQACLIVEAHLPERAKEFRDLYRSSNPEYGGYRGISSYFYEGKNRELFETELQRQKGILLAVPSIIELRALEVTALVTANLVENELDEARLLLEHGFIRGAGAVAGVALEAHLKLLHNQSKLTFTDKDTIVPLATNLRKNNVITLGDEKKCIAMADTRNKCDHKMKDAPSIEEVEELIDDVDRFTKRVQVI